MSGKFVELLEPTTTASPSLSTAMPKPRSPSLPPRYVE
jgi:hypothetical protein